jgi:hypothetical protein
MDQFFHFTTSPVSAGTRRINFLSTSNGQIAFRVDDHFLIFKTIIWCGNLFFSSRAFRLLSSAASSAALP